MKILAPSTVACSLVLASAAIGQSGIHIYQAQMQTAASITSAGSCNAGGMSNDTDVSFPRTFVQNPSATVFVGPPYGNWTTSATTTFSFLESGRGAVLRAVFGSNVPALQAGCTPRSSTSFDIRMNTDIPLVYQVSGSFASALPGATAVNFGAAIGGTPVGGVSVLRYGRGLQLDPLTTPGGVFAVDIDAGVANGPSSGVLAPGNWNFSFSAGVRSSGSHPLHTPAGEFSITLSEYVPLAQQPIGQSICPGATASFSVVAPLASAFGWKINDPTAAGGWRQLENGPQTNSSGVVIGHVTGAYSSTLTITPGQSQVAINFWASLLSVRCAVDGPFGNVTSDSAAFRIIRQCGLSDVSGPNQAVSSCGDGSLTADDIIVFLGWFFTGDSRADVAGSNQSTAPDNTFTADDIIVFLGRYFAGCQ